MDAGYLFKYGDSEELTATIEEILSNYDEAITKTKLAKVYIKSHLSLKDQLVKYENIYKKVLQ